MKHSALSILFLMLGFGALVNANNITKTSFKIQWQGITAGNTPSEKILTFDDAFILDDSKLPYFQDIISIASTQTIDSASIQNIVVADLTDEEKNLVLKTSVTIPAKPTPTIYYTANRKQKDGIIRFVPIINQDGTLKKIVSFDLVYQESGLTTLRSASTTSTHQYATNSVLDSGTWVKVSVSESGIYKITYEDLVKWGISNPANAHIYGYGGAMLPENYTQKKADDLPEVSVCKVMGSDGVFNAGDYILFYAQGPTSWKYNTSSQRFNRTINPYSFYGYYFITSDVGTEKNIDTKAEVTNTPTDTVDYFLDRQIHENESVNIASSGREWYGEVFSSGSADYSFTFSVPNIYTSKKAKVQVDAAAKAGSTTTMSVYENSQNLGSFSFNKLGDYDLAIADSATYQFTPTSSITIKTTYNNTSIGTAWLNYVILNAYRKLKLTDNSLFFRNPDIVGSGNFAKYNITGSSGYVFWNITNPTNIKKLSTTYSDSIYSFVDSAYTLQEYVAVDTTGSFSTPTLVGTVTNQNLHAITQADYVIISPSEYLTQAQSLADKHNTMDGLSTLVVTPEQVYNEFSSGTPDASAYRWIMKMLYDRASSSTDAPKYLLLFGDGTYDNRGINSIDATSNKLLTYQSKNSLTDYSSSYVSDDYFGLLDDADNSLTTNAMDIGVGRIPVSSSTDATNIVSKISTYMNNDRKGAWKNYLAYIADDADASADNAFIYQTDTLAKYIEKVFPSYQPKRFFLDAYTQEVTATGEAYPLAKEKIFDLINSGVLVVNYTGHGSTESLASEKIIQRSDISSMYNKKWPLFVTATCNFSRYDGTSSSTGEDLFLNSSGGAIGMFSAARTVLLTNNFTLNNYFNRYVLLTENNSPLALGEIARRAKNKDLGDENRLSYALLTDPALKLTLPLNKVVTDSITTNISSDTVKALSTVTINGEVQNSSGTLLSNFNGVLTLTVFDKKESLTTLGNDSGTEYTYTDRPNTLFTGRATVTNGKFSTSFIIPKDINYSYGTGRINYYAVDTVNDLEANGYNESFIIGGTNSAFDFEENGPVINMYLNSSNFKSGDQVDATSIFYAQLSDESGINTGSSGIGHDMLLTLNNDSSYVLNDYYESDLGSYKSGSITYTLPTMNNGNYTLSLRAWDVLNNSTTATIKYKVNSGKAPDIYSLYAVPNPAESYVHFILKHDQPESELYLKVEVFDLSGQLLWKNSTTSYADSSTTEIDWNLKTNNGKINPGVYIYRISVESEADGVLASKANKLIVK